MKVIKSPGKDKGCKKCELPEKDLDEIVAALKAGELVVFPTDTLYGLGGDPFKENSVKKVYVAKNRPFDMPLSIAVSNEKMMESVAVLNEPARKLIRKFMPGPLTIMLTKKLPAVSACRVTYDAKATIAGRPSVVEMSCD